MYVSVVENQKQNMLYCTLEGIWIKSSWNQLDWENSVFTSEEPLAFPVPIY